MDEPTDGWTDQPMDAQTLIYRCVDTSNKAVYMTALVAYRWVGEIMQLKSPFGVYLHSLTNGATNRPTN